MKGMLAVRERSSVRTVAVNVVGTSIDIGRGVPPAAAPHCLVAIGMHLDTDAVRSRLADALRPADSPASISTIRRLRRYAANR